jgi:ABC-type oligopeptide transport system substrate-binding subunit
MNRVRSFFCLLFVVCLLAALSSGCGGGSTSKKEDTRSKVEYFRDTHGPTMTPHGKIKMDTIQEASNGKIQYQTEDGKTWRVDMTKQADGTYRYGTPDEVK